MCYDLHHRFDQAKPTHEEHGCFEPLVSGRLDLTKYVGVGDTLFDSDLQAESGRVHRLGKISHHV